MRQVLCPIIVGRDAELDYLATATQAAISGSGGLVFLSGEAGIGKSRLAREAVVHAQRNGVYTLWGRAVAGSTRAPFRPIAQALLSAFRDRDPPDSAALAPYRPYLGRLVPGWSSAETPEESLVTLAEALLRLLRATGEGRGCLLVFEDLHWADPETLAVVEYLADNLADEPVLVVATLRVGESEQAAALARVLESRRVATVLALERLSDIEAEQMAAACLATVDLPPSVRAPLLPSAEGIPFLVEELLATWAASGALASDDSGWELAGPVEGIVPLTFAETVSARISSLGEPARNILEAAALLGRRFDWSLLLDMTDHDEPTVLEALRAGVDAHLLEADREGGSLGFRFRHALTRDALLTALLPPERARIARFARRAVEERYPGLPGEWCELAAELADQAGDRNEATRLLLESGRRALARGALESAESALGRAFRLADRSSGAAAGQALVETLALAGKLERALEVGVEVLALPGTSPVEVHLCLARAAVSAEGWEVAGDHVWRARTSDGGEAAARIDAVAAQVAIGDGRPEDAVRHAEDALRLAGAKGLQDVVCEALEVLGRCARLRDLDEARRFFDQALAIATEHDLGAWRLRALAERATIDLLDRGDVTVLEEAQALAERSGALATAAVLDIQLCSNHYLMVRPKELVEVARRAAEAARRLRLGLLLPMALIWEASGVGHERGSAAMEPLLVKAEAMAGGAPHAHALAAEVRAYIALRDDDREAALRYAQACEDMSRRDPAPNPWAGRGLWALLRTLADPSDDEPRESVRSSGATAFYGNRASLAAADAVAAGRQGDRRAAESSFRRAGSILGNAPWHRHLLGRLVSEAAIEDRWGDPERWLLEAADHFAQTGHNEPLRSACRSLLRRTGAPLPRRGRGESEVPAALRAHRVTSREVDVLRLVTEHLGNVEIAKRLYISPRTVEKHVASLLAKMQARDRRDLAERARVLLVDHHRA